MNKKKIQDYFDKLTNKANLQLKNERKVAMYIRLNYHKDHTPPM